MFVVIHQNDSAATDRNICYFLSKINKQLGMPAYCLSDSTSKVCYLDRCTPDKMYNFVPTFSAFHWVMLMFNFSLLICMFLFMEPSNFKKKNAQLLPLLPFKSVPYTLCLYVY